MEELGMTMILLLMISKRNMRNNMNLRMKKEELGEVRSGAQMLQPLLNLKENRRTLDQNGSGMGFGSVGPRDQEIILGN